MSKIALIDTIPVDSMGKGSINLGFELVANHYNPVVYNWTDRIKEDCDVILFNVFYPTHIFNMVAFLRNNNIPILKSDRKESPYVIAGGQGVSNCNGCVDLIVDEVFKGEVEAGENVDSKGWMRARELNSPFVCKERNSMIELTRGCKYRCKFCEYGWVSGGAFRHKDIELVKEQIDEAWRRERRNINFLSANVNSYPNMDELLDYADIRGIRFTNTDICLRDMFKTRLIERQATVKIGVESFDEKTRAAIGKPISDDVLLENIIQLAEKVNYIHFYLIYGLPDDRYSAWLEWLEKLERVRKSHTKTVQTLFGDDVVNTKNLRFEFSITNFEPCLGTPLVDVPMVDFVKKDEFLKDWGKGLVEHGFFHAESVDYNNSKGRFGRKEEAYLFLMMLKRGGAEITEAIINSFQKGVGRSMGKKQNLDEIAKFLKMCG